MINDHVASPGLAHRRMAPELDLLADLMGGTWQMRAAGERWLPRETAESWSAWRARLNRSFLFNGLARTVQALAGRPFARPVRLDGADPAIMAMANNIDGQGDRLAGFSLQLLRALLIDGMAHILVDRPRRGGPPYFVLVRAAQMLAARRDADGLAEVRILEQAVRAVGQFGEEPVTMVRRLDRDGWQLWQPRPGVATSWAQQAGGTHGLGRVPLISMNVAPTGFLQCRPPLIDLAWLNLAHWQSASDQRHILHVARVPILFGRALQAADGDIEIGPNRLIMADDPAADLRFVEHSGAAIMAGREDLIDLEDRMAVLGLDMMTRRSGDPTATGRAINAAQSHAALNSFVQVLDNGLQAAFDLAAHWLGLPLGAAGKIVITRQFPLGDAQAAEADLLLRARRAGEISKATFLAEIGRRGILAPSDGSVADEPAAEKTAGRNVAAITENESSTPATAQETE